MAITLQVLDSIRAVLADFNTPTGAGNPNSVKTELIKDSFDWGQVHEPRTFVDDRLGRAEKLYTALPPVISVWEFWAEADTAANLWAGLKSISGILLDPRPRTDLKLIWDAGTDTLLSGLLGAMEVPSLLAERAPRAYPTRRHRCRVRVLRQAISRMPAVTVGPTTISNDPAAANARSLLISGVGTHTRTPARIELEATAIGLTKVAARARSLAARPVGMTIADWRSNRWRQSESGTLGTDASTVADAATSGGNYVSVGFATATMQTRLTHTWTAAQAAQVRGRVRIGLQARMSDATTAASVVIRYRLGSTTSPSRDLTAVAIPTGSTAWNLVNLGSFYIDEFPGVAGLVIEVRAERTAGTGALHMDFVVCDTADEQELSLAAPSGTSPAVGEAYVAESGVAAIESGDLIVAPATRAGAAFLSLADGDNLVELDLHEASGAPIARDASVSVSYEPVVIG